MVSPDKIPPPSGLATDSEAEQGEAANIAWKRWGLAATKWALHKAHIDTVGAATYVTPKNGQKLWIVAIPNSIHDMGKTSAFSSDFTTSLGNSQQWKTVAFLLGRGDTLIMGPCSPHYVVTLEPSVTLGGHMYNMQTLCSTGYALFHTLVASSLLTNTRHKEAPRSFQYLAKFFDVNICDDGASYRELIERAGSELKEDGTHIIPHLPNFTLMDDVQGFLMLYNIIQLGTVLDYRQYMGALELEILDDEHHIPKNDLSYYQAAKVDVNRVRDWLIHNVKITLCHTSGKVEQMNIKDYSDMWLSAIARTLVVHKIDMECLGIEGEHHLITASAIKAAIENEFKGDPTFQKSWPRSVKGDNVTQWVESWRDKKLEYTYAPPLPPADTRYILTLV
ncbi:hypothetical protein F5879DRAFT_993205 [Lentinula edodes]|nr:hypothetical protein F5879DRAFT_993205 [Lentinula edodes]